MNLEIFFSQTHDDLPAVIENDRIWNYREFKSQVNIYVNYLTRNQTQKVLIDLSQGFYSYAFIWASYLAGVPFCPINATIPTDRKKYFVNIFEPELIVTDGLFIEGPYITKSINDTEFALTNQQLSELEVRQYPDTNLAYVIFTSGSTGQPKGVKIPRKGLENFLTWSINEYALKLGQRCGQYSNLGFDLSICDIFTVISSTAVLVTFKDLHEKLFPGRLIKKHQISFWHSVPTVINLLYERDHITKEIIGQVDIMTYCGETLYPKHLELLFDANPNLIIYNTYGPTETTIFCTFIRLTKSNYKEYCNKTVSIGKPIPGFKIELVNIENGVGEILIIADHISNNYVNVDNGNAGYTTVIRSGKTVNAYLTGDYGYIIDDNLYFAYRKDAQIKISGHRIDLSEIDYHIQEFGYFVCKTIYKNNKIISFVQSKEFSEKDLRNHLKTKLPSYYFPHLIIQRSALPMSENNKINISELSDSLDTITL